MRKDGHDFFKMRVGRPLPVSPGSNKSLEAAVAPASNPGLYRNLGAGQVPAWSGYWVNEKRVLRIVRRISYELSILNPISESRSRCTICCASVLPRLSTRCRALYAWPGLSLPHSRTRLALARYVLSWELSNTLAVNCCLQALFATLHRVPAPNIYNFDQCNKFT
jgi:hypothetical protein